MFEMGTEWGQIHFSRNVIQQICISAVDSCGGSAMIMNYGGKSKGKGKGIASLAPKMGRIDNDEIVVEEREDGLFITIYVVIRFGASIKDTAEHILDRVFEQMEEVMNVVPKQVLVVNTGTASKDIAPRHMEFYRTAEKPTDGTAGQADPADGTPEQEPADR